MAWRKIKVEEQRCLFIKAYLEKKFNFSDLCIQFDISRPCGYKWVKKFEKEGWEGLQDSSKAPLNSPTATSSKVTEEILKLKYAWPKWGPKKILGKLINLHPEVKWPCMTTVENILKKNGLVERRKLRKNIKK